MSQFRKGSAKVPQQMCTTIFILKSLILLTIATMVMVNGDEADAVLQSVLLWTCARLFDWVITLFRDALACDEQDESNHYHSSLV